MPNEKYLTFKIISEKVYDVVFTGVSVVDTILATFSITNLLSFIITARNYVIFSLSSVMTNSYVVKLSTNIIQSFSSGIGVVYSIKETLKIAFSFLSETTLVYVFKETLKAITTLSGSIVIVMTPIFALINPLSDYDPGTLGDIDAETLGDLDYTLVT